MITLYSNWWIKPGNEKKVKKALVVAAAEIKKKEKGTLRYLVHYARLDFPKKYSFKSEPKQRPGSVTFIETYESWNAFNAHVKGEPFNNFLKKYGNLFVQDEEKECEDSKPFIQVVFLEEVAGFDRLGKRTK